MSKGLEDLKTNLIEILERLPKPDELDRLDQPDETELLKHKLKNCNDANELIDLGVQTLKLSQKFSFR